MRSSTLAFLFFATTALAAEPSSLQQLPAGDTLHVSYTSSGCFHHREYEFEFQRGENVTAIVTKIFPAFQDTRGRKKKAERISLGTVTLKKSEVAGLDRLFAFYRSKPEGGCTTVDEITLKQTRDGKPVAAEAFTDGSCGTREMKHVTPLPTLAEMLETKGEAKLQKRWWQFWR